MEFLIVFVLSFIFLLGLVVALAIGKSPSYRPKRKEILALLQQVSDGDSVQDRWYLFLSIPASHDPELEMIRLKCLAVDEGDEQNQAASEGLSGAVYDKAGRERIRLLHDELARIIKQAPVSRWF